MIVTTLIAALSLAATTPAPDRSVEIQRRATSCTDILSKKSTIDQEIAKLGLKTATQKHDFITQCDMLFLGYYLGYTAKKPIIT